MEEEDRMAQEEVGADLRGSAKRSGMITKSRGKNRTSII